MPPLSVSESPSEEGRDRVKSSSPDESFVECTSKSSEPVSPVEVSYIQYHNSQPIVTH